MMFERLSTKTFRSFAALLLAAVFILCILPPGTAAAVASGAWSLSTNPSNTYSSIYDMCDGKYFIVSDSSGLYGLMNANLEYVVNPQYSNIEIYPDFILVCKNRLWGILDGNCNTVVATYYDSIRYSNNDNTDLDDGILIYSLNGRQGLIRTDGTVLTNPAYYNLNHICNNTFTHGYENDLQLFIIGSNTTDSNIYKSINLKGDGYLVGCLSDKQKSTIIINSLGEMHTVQEGYYVQEYLGDDRFLIVNDPISVPTYQARIWHWDGSSVQLSTATHFLIPGDDGYMIKHNLDDTFSVVFRDGTEYTQKYADLMHLGKGRFLYRDSSTGPYGIVNADGTTVVAPKYDYLVAEYSNSDGTRSFTLSCGGKRCGISWQGEIIPCIYNYVDLSLGIVELDNKYGAYDLSSSPTSLVVEVIYRSLDYLGDGFYSFSDTTEKYGIIKDGHVIKDPQYDNVRYCGNNGFILSLNGRFGAFAYGGSVDTECIYDDIICSFEPEYDGSRWHTQGSSQAFFVFSTSIPSGSNNDSGSNGNNDGGNSGAGGGGSTNSFGSSPINFFSGNNDGVKMKVLIDGKETEVTLTLNNFTYNYDTPVQVTTICSYNLRKGPDASYGTYKKVRKGAKLTIIGRDRDWLIVDMGGGKPAYILEGMVR